MHPFTFDTLMKLIENEGCFGMKEKIENLSVTISVIRFSFFSILFVYYKLHFIFHFLNHRFKFNSNNIKSKDTI